MNPTTQQPTYELLKDILTYKAGEKFILDAELGCYIAEKKDSFGKRATWHPVYVEGLPDWFRRVEVKDWEVVDCLEFNGKAIHPYHEGICLGKYKGVKPCTIHSVRRLSDGETFTVGEDCGYLSISLRSEKPNTTAVIEKFEIKENDIWAYGKNGFFIASLNKLVKLPSPPVEQETIKVNKMYFDCHGTNSWDYVLEMSKSIPDSKKEAVKKAIEDALNDSEPKWAWGKPMKFAVRDFGHIPKPPLGLKPLWVHNEERLVEINDTIIRYMESGKAIPKEWTDEYHSLISFMVEYESNRGRSYSPPKK